MPTENRAGPELEIAHVLAMDVVGYSTLLIDNQSRLIAELTRLVRETPCFRAAEGGGKADSPPDRRRNGPRFFRQP